MSPVIRIDEEVLGALENRAVQFRLVFGNPNQVLRKMLGLDDGPEESGTLQPTSPHPTPLQPGTRLSVVGSQSPRVRGGRVLALHPDLRQQGLRPYSDREGRFYQWPIGFPAVFFDQGGYAIFKTEESMLAANQYLTAYTETSTVYLRDGISSLPDYVACSPNCHRHLWGNSP